MKLFVALFLVCTAVGSIMGDDVDNEQMHKVIADCKAETGASDEDVAVVFQREPARSGEEKCLRACAMKKMGAIDGESHLNTETTTKIVQSLAQGDAEKEAIGAAAVVACADIEVPADHCEAAEAYYMCMAKILKESNYPNFQ